MIENIRKYTGLMAVVFVLLAVAFLFTMNDINSSRGGPASGSTLLSAHGKNLDQQAYRSMGEGTLHLAASAGLNVYINYLMAPPNPQQILQLEAYGLNYYTVSRSNLSDQDIVRFITNRLTLQKAMNDMGLYASEEAVSESIKKAPGFSSGGNFDAAAYKVFIEERIGSLGMTEQDLRDIVREELCLKKLISIIGGGLTTPPSAVRDLVESQLQTVTYSRVAFDLESFIKKEEPSEEEIKTYWEAHQDAYQTDETRRINYVLLDVPEKAPLAQKPLAADATEEQKKAHEEADKLAKAQREEEIAAAATKLKREINSLSQVFYDIIDEKAPLKFEMNMSENGQTVLKTELFTRSKLPAELSKFNTLRGSVNSGKTLANTIFQIAESSDPYYKLSEPIPVGQNAWIMFTLEEIVKPTLLEYDAARDAARTDLIAENAGKKMKTAAKDAQKIVSEALEAGKDFKTVAKENNYTVTQVGPYSPSGTPPSNEPSYSQLFIKASTLNPNEVSEPIDESSRSLFIHLEKREFEESEQNKGRITSAIETSKRQLSLLTWLNWVEAEAEKANISGLVVESK